MIVLIISILILIAVAYFMYAHELHECCDLLGFKDTNKCYVPLINKYMLLKLEDVEGDNNISIPLVNVTVSRTLIASILAYSQFLVAISDKLGWLALLLSSVCSLVVWNEIGNEFQDETRSESMIQTVFCSLFCLHIFQWIRLYNFKKLLLSAYSEYDESADDENGYDEDLE